MAKCIPCLLVLTTLLSNCMQVLCEFCRSYGHSCTYPERCCEDQCCESTDYEHQYTHLRFNIWNMWYFWFAILFTLMTCLGACGYWRKRRLFFGHDRFMQVELEQQYRADRLTLQHTTAPFMQQLVRIYPNQQGFQVGPPVEPVHGAASEAVQGSFPCPPPYCEVISKPDQCYDRMDKDNLPPYPGLPTSTETPGGIHYAARSDHQPNAAVSVEQVSGLPPYTAAPQVFTTNTQGLTE